MPEHPWARPHRLLLYFVLAFALALRCYHLTDPAWDYHNWRQTITLMVARDYSRRFDLLHPTVLWLSNGVPAYFPNYFNAEFSLQSILATVLYRLTGESDAAARLVVIAFSLAGIAWLYQLLNRRAGPLAAFLGALLLSVLPYSLFFGRVFMPDVPAMSLALGGLSMLDRWTDGRRTRDLISAAALTSLAVLQKLPVVFVGLPMLYLFGQVYGRRILLRREAYIFAGIALLPSLAWYLHAYHLGRKSGSGIMQPGMFFSGLQQWLHLDFAIPLFKAVAVEAFSPLALALVIIGFFWPASDRMTWLLRLWLIGAAGILGLMPGVLPANHYYFVVLLPGGAGLMALALARLTPDRRSYGLLAIVVCFVAMAALQSTAQFFVPDRAPYEMGRFLNRVTAPTDLIVTETGGSPQVLYYADRRGWMLDRQYDPAVLERFRSAGAVWYADTFVNDAGEHAGFFQALDARFRRTSPPDAPWRVYRLR
jgi:4-amino-4-deoxy-L-arabinose transferase-like glycosyltransferase